jgi:hypothetical protein
MAFNTTTMKELKNFNAKLDLIRKNKDEVNANTANLNATLTHIKGAHPKEDTANDFINGWARKFIELFDECNTSPPATDPIQLENNGDTVVTDIQPRLDHKNAPIINLGTTITAKPSLLAAPYNKDAVSHVAAGHLHSDLINKIGDNNNEHPRPESPSAMTMTTTTTPPALQPPL